MGQILNASFGDSIVVFILSKLPKFMVIIF